MGSATSKPVKVCFCDGVTGTVWITPRVKGDKVVEVPSIRFDKAYEVEGERKYTTAFFDEDLPKVALVAMELYRVLKVRFVEPAASEGQAKDDGKAREERTR